MNISNNDHKYTTTETTIYACEYHIIWSTKYRRSVLSPEIQERLKALIFEQQEAYQYVVREVESMPDHVHLLASISPSVSVTSVISKSATCRISYTSAKIAMPMDTFKVCCECGKRYA